jgi:hypothetical protein
MSEPSAERQPSNGTAAAIRGLLVYLAIAVPIAAGLFLYSADLLDAYHGAAACHRPLPRSDGVGDQVMRFVLVRPGNDDLELVLPTAAFESYDLPRCNSGVPPRDLVEGAPEVHKSAFDLSFSVEDRSWPTTSPGDLFLPVLLLLLGLPLRNYLVTGSPLLLAGDYTPPPVLQTRPRASAPKSTGIGPPPAVKRRGGRRRRR